jgi:hypothetical protein
MRDNQRMKLAVLWIGLAVAISPAPADACSCAGQRVWAAIESTAPTNTHVMLWFVDGLYKATPTFTLREAGEKQVVAVDRRDVKSGGFNVTELIPKQPLRARAAYEVVDGKDSKVLEFTTTVTADTNAPTWNGILTAEYVKQPGACCTCNTGVPYVRVKTAGIADDAGARHVVYAVWATSTSVRGNATKIDYTKPPMTYVPPYGGEFSLGSQSTCGASNFDLATGAVIKLGLRPIDFAGNLGEPREVFVDLWSPPKQIPD